MNDLELLDTFIKIKSAFEATKLDFIIYKVNTFNIEISKCDTSEVTDMLDMLFGLKMYSYLLILQVRSQTHSSFSMGKCYPKDMPARTGIYE